MKIYYVITRVEHYIAYTTNLFLYKTYLNQIRSVSKDEILIHGDVDVLSESVFLIKLNNILVGIGSKLPFNIDKDNGLFSIKDENSDNFIVLTHLIYNSFVKEFIEYNELSKILTNLYLNFGHHGGKLDEYILGNDGEFILELTLKVFHEYYPNIKAFRDYNRYDLYRDIQDRLTSKFWENYNEYYEINTFFYTFLKTSDFKKIMSCKSLSW